MSKSLVLAGGGLAGIAWQLGVIEMLRADGVDLTTADLVVGTSAGSVVGAQILTGQLDAAVAQQQRPAPPQRPAQKQESRPPEQKQEKPKK